MEKEKVHEKTKLFFVSLLSVAMLSTGTVVYAAKCAQFME